MKRSKYSFEQYCIDNQRQDLLELWDYEKNKQSPSETSYRTIKKMFFKCKEYLHDSSAYSIADISNGKIKNIKCRKCNSFAFYAIKIFGEEIFAKIWNVDNTEDPWKIAHASNKKIILNCLNEGHTYITTPILFFNHTDSPCTICGNRRIVSMTMAKDKNALLNKLWSDKNEKSPDEYTLHSAEKVWWKCNNNIHEDYYRAISSSYDRDYECPECARGETADFKREDLTGQVFGKLIVLELDKEKTKETGTSYWITECECGEQKSIPSIWLKDGRVKTCGNKSLHGAGENNPNWKGGITPEKLSIRTSKEYIQWRDSVYAKDWYTCQCCGKSKGIIKNAHHIFNFATNIEDRMSISNGICLCRDCHYSTIPGSFHNIYGTVNNNGKQLEEYINFKRKELGIDELFSIEEYLNGKVIKPNTF